MPWGAYPTGNAQLVTSEGRCVPLLSDIKVRNMKEVFFYCRLANFLSRINNIPLLPSSLLQQMTAVKFLDKEASAMCTVPFKSNVLYTETCTYQSFIETP